MYNKIAPKYFDLGINVVPVSPGAKACKVKNWRNIDFESTYENYKKFGVGLDLGTTDVVVLDIDTTDNDAKKEIEEFLKDYPTPVMRSGNPNKLPSRFYSKTWQDTKIKHGQIELLTVAKDGESICVLPPTKHPDFENVNFEWTTKKTLLNFPIDDLPELPIEAWEGVCRIIDKYTKTENGKQLTEVYESDGSRCNHGSHNKLSDILVASIHDSESPDDIVNKLLAYDEKINDKVSYFLCPSRKEWKTRDRKFNCYQFVMQGFENKLKNKEIQEMPSDVRITIGEPIKIKQKERVRFPKLRGYGQELFDICYNHSPIPKSRFASISVLSLISTIMGNKYSYNGLQPNIYSILITGQGGGKDFPLKFPKQVLLKMGLNDLVGMSNPASDVALIMNLEKQRTRIDTIDEATRLFKGMNSKGASHSNSMAEMVNELYSAPCSYFGGKSAQKYQDPKKNEKGNIGACYSPYVTLIGATTFSGFEKTFNEELFESGLGSRFFYIIDDKVKPPRRVDPRFELSHDLKDFLMAIYKSQKTFIDLSDKPILYEMQATQKAELAIDAFSDYCFEIIQKSEKTQRIKSMHSRLCLHVQKLAMIDAVLMSGNIYPKITIENVEWAIKWCMANVKSVEDHINTSVSSNFFESEMNKIEAIILSGAEKGKTKTEISKAARNIDNYKKYLTRLLESENIFAVRFDSDAPNAKRFIHSTFYK